MKKCLLIFVILILPFYGSFAQDMPARLDSLMNYYSSEYNFNGVVLVASKGDVVFEKSYGYKNIAKKEKHDDNSIFQIGTITTQFTAEAIFMLAKEHKLSLEDKLNKYFPKFPKGDSITIRNLLTNTTGIMDYFMFEGYLDKYDSVHIKPDSLLALFDKRRPQGNPGTRFQFSNSNYVLLGFIIEKLTHKSYSAAIRDMILKPAGMTHSGFDYLGLKNDHKTTGYRHYSEDETSLQPMDSSLLFSSAGLYSTAGDMYLWHKALQSYKFLDKNTQDSMYRPFVRNYGYGWFADTVFNQIAALDGGQIRGFSSYIYRIPSENLCIILLQNINFPAVDNYTLSHKITGAFFDTTFTMPVPTPAITLSTGILDRYVGEYVFPSGISIVITREGDGLHAHNIPPKGEPNHATDFDMEPVSANTFKTKALNAPIEFKNDGQGNVEVMIMHNPRHDIVAKKKKTTGK